MHPRGERIGQNDVAIEPAADAVFAPLLHKELSANAGAGRHDEVAEQVPRPLRVKSCVDSRDEDAPPNIMSIPWLRPPEFDQSREMLWITMSQYDSKAGVLLVGHGTRSAVGAAQFLALANHLSREFAPLPVEPAFLELRQPDVRAAVEALAGRGISRLIVVPLMLFTAGHVKRDVPQAVQAALLEHDYAQLEVAYADDIGCDL